FGDPILAFALSGRGLLGAIFHRALPCAMGFLPRWGGLVLPVSFPLLLSASTPTAIHQRSHAVGCPSCVADVFSATMSVLAHLTISNTETDRNVKSGKIRFIISN
ncbi:MAG: hypothetical protein LBQ66_01405, partial [Planctomycetaceae bacterium]|nr:hypothetical protein [Planctomycetaceae bacterium]